MAQEHAGDASANRGRSSHAHANGVANAPRDGQTDRTSKFSRRLAWIGEGLLGGAGIHAVERLESLAVAEHARQSAASPTNFMSGMPWMARLSQRRNSLEADASPRAIDDRPPASALSGVHPALTKKRSRFLNFWATEIGEQYLKNVYQDEEREELLSDSESDGDEAVEVLEEMDERASMQLEAFLALEQDGQTRESSRAASLSELVTDTEDSPKAGFNANGDMSASLISTDALDALGSTSLDDLGDGVVDNKTEDTPRSAILDTIRNRSFSSWGDASASGDDARTRFDSLLSLSAFRPYGDADGSSVPASPATVPMSPLLMGGNGSLYNALASFKLGDASSEENERYRFPPFTPFFRRSSGSESSGGDVSRTTSEGNRSRMDSLQSLSGYRTQTAEEADHISSGYSEEYQYQYRHDENSSTDHVSPQLSAASQQQQLRYQLSPLLESQSAPTSANAASSPVPPVALLDGIASDSTVTLSGELKAIVPQEADGVELSSKRADVVSTLRNMADICESRPLSGASLQRISTLLATMEQIIADDERSAPAPAVHRTPPRWPGDDLIAQAVSEQTKSAQKNKNEQHAKDQFHEQDMSQEEMQEQEHEHEHEYQHEHEQDAASTRSSDAGASPRKPPAIVVASTVMASMAAFESAQNLFETLAAFQRLLKDVGLDEASATTPLRAYQHIKSAIYEQLSFRQKALFRLLDNKLALDVYSKQPCAGKRVCVVGGGPVGLRTAVELALMGASVVVLERRKHFAREHIMHIWPWVVQDLTSLGAKVFFPAFCHSTAYFHIGVRQLQCILLKVALLLGVVVYPGTAFEALLPPDRKPGHAKPFYSIVTKPQIPSHPFTAVLSACGSKDKVSTQSGIKRFVFSRKEAIGIMCYFPNLHTAEEKSVKEFSWSNRNKHRVFEKLRGIGVDLENIVYYRGEVHYLVMTPKRANLLEQGVLKVNYPAVSDVVTSDNVDDDALRAYASRVVHFLDIKQKADFTRVHLFDFSTRVRASPAAKVLTAQGQKLYVSLVGDALIDSFWPEGVGICRGFLSAMDACWLVAQIGRVSEAQLLADRELGYRIVQHISGQRRGDLHKNVRKYNVDPSSRYTRPFPAALPAT